MERFKVLEPNPYAVGAEQPALAGPALRFHPFLSWVLLCLAVLVVGWPWYFTGPLTRGRYVCVFLYLLPPLHWEFFCRQTPRPVSWAKSALSTILRCCFTYFVPHVACYVAAVATVMMLNPSAPWTPQPTTVLGLCILGGAFAFVRFDYWMARRGGSTCDEIEASEVTN